MTLTDIAIQNLRRRKGKTIFLILTFLLSVGTTVALAVLASNMQDSLQQSLAKYGANIVITPRSKHFALSYGGIAVPGVNFQIQKLDYDIPAKIKVAGVEISIVAPKIIGSAQGLGKSYLIAGVDFSSELRMKPWLRIKGKLPQQNQVVIGATLAAKEPLGIGSTIKLNGQSYPIVGVLSETGGSEDNAVFTDFQTAEKLTGLRNVWSLIEINSPQPDATAAKLAALLPQAKVAEVTQLVQGTKESVDRFAAYALFTSVLLAVIGFLIVAVTMIGSVNERTSELGIFRAIGFRRRHIISILLREILVVSVVGSLLGYGLGIIAPPLLGPVLLQKSIGFQPHLLLGGAALFGAVAGGVAAIAFPAWRALLLDPAEALRYI